MGLGGEMRVGAVVIALSQCMPERALSSFVPSFSYSVANRWTPLTPGPRGLTLKARCRAHRTLRSPFLRSSRASACA